MIHTLWVIIHFGTSLFQLRRFQSCPGLMTSPIPSSLTLSHFSRDSAKPMTSILFWQSRELQGNGLRILGQKRLTAAVVTGPWRMAGHWFHRFQPRTTLHRNLSFIALHISLLFNAQERGVHQKPKATESHWLVSFCSDTPCLESREVLHMMVCLKMCVMVWAKAGVDVGLSAAAAVMMLLSLPGLPAWPDEALSCYSG